MLYAIHMIVTISGLPGSGKSTIGKMLAEHLSYRFYSMGDLRGKMALDRGMTIDELNKLGEKEDWTDKETDEYQKKLGQTEDNFIIDGRLSYYFIPQSFKLFLDVDPEVAAQRVFKNPRPDESPKHRVEEVQKGMSSRLASDARRYKQYYGIIYPDPKAFDLVVNTSHLTPDEIFSRIMDKLKPKTQI